MTAPLITDYLAGRAAYRVLVGEIDKAEQTDILRKGYAAVVSLKAQGMSLDAIAKAAGLSKSKVERDVRAGNTIARLPKVSPVLIVTACNYGTAAKIDTATTAKALTDIVKKGRDKQNTDKANRAARPNDGTTPDATGTPGTGPKAPARVVTLETIPAFIASKPRNKSDIPALEAIIKAAQDALVVAKNNKAA